MDNNEIEIGGVLYDINSNEIVEIKGEYYLKDNNDVVEIDGEYYLKEDDNVCFDEINSCYELKDNCVYGWIDRRNQGWMNSSEALFIECADEYFASESVAEYRGFSYCSHCDEWQDEYHSHDDEDDRNFNNINKKPMRSTTHTETNGMRYTFGVEIETSNGVVSNDDRYDYNWACVDDGSIDGGEYVTGIFKGDKGFKELKGICKALESSNHEVDEKCGLHVHIGDAHFNKRFSILSIMLGCQLEDELFAMLPPSRQNNSYCRKIKKGFSKTNMLNGVKQLGRYVFGDTNNDKEQNQLSTGACYLNKKINRKQDREKYCDNRYVWLNLVRCNQATDSPTIEFRQHSGTITYDKIKNCILICMSFVNFVENHQRRIIEGGVTLKEVIEKSLGKKAPEVLKYVEERTKKFSPHLFKNVEKEKTLVEV